MLIIPVDQLQEGSCLAAPVLQSSEPGTALIKRDGRLDRPAIDAIQSAGIEAVYVRAEGTESLDKHLAFHSSLHAAALGALVRQAEHDFSHGANPAALCFEEHYRRIRSLTDALTRIQGTRYYYPQLVNDSYRFEMHSVAVTHLSLLLGLQLGDYLATERKNLGPDHAREVTNLGVAALLHDVGKMLLPASIRGRNIAEPPFTDQLAQWKSHTRAGFDLLQGRIEASASVAILGHHLRFDGKLDRSGSAAAAQSGRAIHIFARILSAADLFDRLSNPRPGVRRSNLEVFHLIRTQHAGELDPVVLRALIAVAPPIMPGTRVELADRTQAVVISVDPARPLFPVVKRMGRDYRSLSPVPIDIANAAAPDLVSANGTMVHRFSNSANWGSASAA